MAGAGIQVKPERLEAAASEINKLMSQYQTSYEAIYSSVDKMTGCDWVGEDSEKYVANIKKFKTNFEELQKYLETVGKFLTEAAKEYRESQKKISNAASL